MAAIVLLSGGMDSAVAAAWWVARGHEVHGVGFDYGQRHQVELRAAARVADHLCLNSFMVVRVDIPTLLGPIETSLINGTGDLGLSPDSTMPVSYVPARNTLFLAHALAVAERWDADRIVIGANAEDQAGYPDCRPEFLEAFGTMASLASGREIRISAPLIGMSKAEIVRLGHSLDVDFDLTVSCYNATEELMACGYCDACALRFRGFANA